MAAALLLCAPVLAPDARAQSRNVALGQWATQSSTYFAGGAASRAVDGNTNGTWGGASLTHTDYQYQAWWEVDLGAVYQLGQIYLWNRTDCCGERLSNFYVLVSDQPFSTDLNTALGQPLVSSYYTHGQAGTTTTIAVGRAGRYVRVQLAGTNYLSLAEVEVWDAPVTNSLTEPPINVALASNGGTAYASSTYNRGGDYHPSYAINGNRSGSGWGFPGGGWNDNTENDWTNDWLEVRFAGMQTIYQVNVFSVQDEFWNPREPTPSMTFTTYGLVDFKVQYWKDSAWLTLQNGNITGNNLVWRQITFAKVRTERIRVLVTRALNTWTRITEVEVIQAPSGCALKPTPLEKEVLSAINNEGQQDAGTLFWETPPVAKWRRCLDATFSSWAVNGSQNLPVLAAAVGLFREPTAGVQNNDLSRSSLSHMQWWVKYLGYQVGELTDPPNNGVRYFKGKESFSNVYDAAVVSSVLAARLWAARKLNDTNPAIRDAALKILNYSKAYLRAQWLIYGLTAGPDAKPARSYDLPGRTASPTPSPNTQYNPNAPLNSSGNSKYGGHFLAMAGARSNLDHWVEGERPALFDRALGQYPPPTTNESPDQRALLNRLQELWPLTTDTLYGLNRSDQDAIRRLANTGDLTYFKPDGVTIPWLSKILTAKTFRFLGWNENGSQVRASQMSSNPNGNSPCIYAVKYEAALQKATFLYPWWDVKPGGNRFPAGSSQLLSNKITANNGPGIPGWHPPIAVEMPIPTTGLLFHVVLSPTQTVYQESVPQSYYPAYEPYDPYPYDPLGEDPDTPEF
jgi:hypothetical protein